MKISELMAELERIKAEHGDLPVLGNYDDGWGPFPFKITTPVVERTGWNNGLKVGDRYVDLDVGSCYLPLDEVA